MVAENSKRLPLGGKPFGKKMHLVKWGIVPNGKNLGRLGIRRLETLNKALHGKWLSRFEVEDNCLFKVGYCWQVWGE